MWKISAPVVVGIDGSGAAINAAKWAVDEAISRDVPLRIVLVTHIEGQPVAPGDDFRLDLQYAEWSLRAATAAVEATGKPVKIETDILWGSPDTALINESRTAAMICVGSVGIGAIAKELWGSTAARLAEKAYCPVAIIRSPHNQPPSGPDWIVVAVQGHADDESVIEYAMDEARLRHAPVLAVGVWQEDFGETGYDDLDSDQGVGKALSGRPCLSRGHPRLRPSILGRKQGRICAADGGRRRRCTQCRRDHRTARSPARRPW
jgi:nucleotide-binding universal stress UspA family protein